MAFAVTPTSGEGPFTYTASFANKLGFDLGLYSLEFRGGSAVGSCPASGISGTNVVAAVNSLLETGSWLSSGTVIPPGSCRTTSLIIRLVADGSIIEESLAQINNV